MSSDSVTLPQIVSVVGGFAGMLSLGILLIRYLFEKPKLKTIVEKSHYRQPDSTYNFTEFFIELRFENKGRRNTTIHNIELSFEYKGEKYNPPLQGKIEAIVIADGVKRLNVIFQLQKHQYVIPEGIIQNAMLKVTHLYDINIIQNLEIIQD